MDYLKEAFDLLIRGVMISINSNKYLEIANFLSIEDNFDELEAIFTKVGYTLVGENGYFYIVKNTKLSKDEVESFFNSHKKIIVAISILKQLYPLIGIGDKLKQTDFIIMLNKKEDEGLKQKMAFIYEADLKTQVEEFFKLLEKSFVIEKEQLRDKDSYKILNSLNYYVKIIESI